jgi:hypothetical protein
MSGGVGEPPQGRFLLGADGPHPSFGHPLPPGEGDQLTPSPGGRGLG